MYAEKGGKATCLAALKHLFVNVIHHSIGPIQIDGLVHIDLTSDPTALLRVSDALLPGGIPIDVP